MNYPYRDLTFPAGFLWGAATSAYQVEGGSIHSDWWQWKKSGSACEHYTLYEKDFNIAKELGHNAHRFSLEWSRIEPKEGEYDAAAINHYRKVIAALKERQITPLVTLFHFTLPLWAAKKGGFGNPQIAYFFQRYATRVCQEFAGDIDYWITLNEPIVYIYMAYILGKWPPGRQIGTRIIAVLKNLLCAHAAGYQAIHKTSLSLYAKEPRVGLAKHIRIFTPFRKSFLSDIFAARLKDCLFNDWFLQSVASGMMKPPLAWYKRLPGLKGSLDFIGLNYYTREFTRFNFLKPDTLFAEVKALNPGDNSDLGWEIYPQGIYLALRKLKKYKLPIIITENGLADRFDKKRADFILRHLAYVHQAISKGIDVRGYLHWSLLDNFEWAEGFFPRFGLLEVDYTSQKRAIRPSAYAFGGICKSNNLRIKN